MLKNYRQQINLFEPMLILFSLALAATVLDYSGGRLGVMKAMLSLLFILLLWVAQSAFEMYALNGNIRHGKDVDGIPLRNWLIIGGAALAALAMLVFMMMLNGMLTVVGWLLLVVMLVLALIPVVEPYRQKLLPYREFIKAVLFFGMMPVWFFVVCTGALHRLSALTAFPVVALGTSYLIVEHFAKVNHASKINQKAGLLNTAGWKTAMLIHNSLVLIGFLFISLAMALGLTWKIALPALSGLIPGVIQIITMIRVGQGAKPVWRFIRLNALITVSMTIYMLMFGFWLN